MEEIKFRFGLNRMKERLELFHGTVSVHSESGEGTFVICNIPLQTEPVQDAIRLLIVDDQVIITESLKQILDQHAEFKVVSTARDGREVLEHCDRCQPDIVLIWIFVCREWTELRLYLR